MGLESGHRPIGGTSGDRAARLARPQGRNLPHFAVSSRLEHCRGARLPILFHGISSGRIIRSEYLIARAQMRGRSFLQPGFPMDEDHVAYLRDHAHALVKLARKVMDDAIAGELQAMAVEVLERARVLENNNKF